MTPRLALLFLISSPALSAEPGHFENLEAARFKAMGEQKQGLYLDVRTPQEVALGRLAGTSVIDIHDPKFEQKVALLPRNRPIFVYCGSGVRSVKAAETMQKLGFAEVYNLTGGMRAWTAAGLPVEHPAEARDSAEGLEPAAFDAILKAEHRVLVDYQTPWCAPCQKMSSLIDSIAQVHKGKAKILKVDVDQSEALVARERIDAVPVFVLYVDGKERRRAKGEQPREELERLLTQEPY